MSKKPVVQRECEVCQREAVYLCGDCKGAAYCSVQHRGQHWYIHKNECKILMVYTETTFDKQVKQKRFLFRKQYYDFFSHKIYDQALKIAQKMVEFQKQNIQTTRFIQHEFQYGITVCLLCRTLIILGKKNEAKIQISEYLKEKYHFLQDLRDICRFDLEENKESKEQVTKPDVQINPRSKQFLRKKLQLISAVANIYNSLSLSPLQFYTIYLKHVQFAFGPESLQASNCFFLIGTYYMEQQMYNRSIACFVRAADLRGPKAADCYYNLAIIYELRGKIDVAIKMFQLAINLHEKSQGESSLEVAKIYEQIAHLLIKKHDWNAAIKAFQKALKIYAIKNQLPEFQIVKQKIKALHQYMKTVLNSKDKGLPKQIQDQLSEKKTQEVNPKELKQDPSSVQQAKWGKQRFNIDNLFKLSDNFLSRLNPLEIFRLSQLQLELQSCTSQYALAYIVSNSEFLRRLSEKRLKEMKQENEKLFELMNVQRKSVSKIVQERLFNS